MDEVTVSLVKLEDGRYVAASQASPYFCFEAESEDAVKRKVDAAIAFYDSAKRDLRDRRQHQTQITVTRVYPYARVKRQLQEVA